jgi:nucleoside phosphorylase
MVDLPLTATQNHHESEDDVRTMNKGFVLTGVAYIADAETIKLLRRIMPSARATGDVSAVAAMMYAGLHSGRIVKA